MSKPNRTTLEEQPPQQNGAALELKVKRGKHPNSRRKAGEELVRVHARIFKRQAPASNEEIRAALDFYRARPD